jgi:hypothetical protein
VLQLTCLVVLSPPTMARATRLFRTLDFCGKGYAALSRSLALRSLTVSLTVSLSHRYLDSHTFGLAGHPHARFHPPLRDTWERFLEVYDVDHDRRVTFDNLVEGLKLQALRVQAPGSEGGSLGQQLMRVRPAEFPLFQGPFSAIQTRVRFANFASLYGVAGVPSVCIQQRRVM